MPALEVFWSGYFVLHYMFLKFTVIWRRVGVHHGRCCFVDTVDTVDTAATVC